MKLDPIRPSSVYVCDSLDNGHSKKRERWPIWSRSSVDQQIAAREHQKVKSIAPP